MEGFKGTRYNHITAGVCLWIGKIYILHYKIALCVSVCSGGNLDTDRLHHPITRSNISVSMVFWRSLRKSLKHRGTESGSNVSTCKLKKANWILLSYKKLSWHCVA